MYLNLRRKLPNLVTYSWRTKLIQKVTYFWEIKNEFAVSEHKRGQNGTRPKSLEVFAYKNSTSM